MKKPHNEDAVVSAVTSALKYTQHEVREVRSLVTGKPANYRVNLISLGEVGYEFAKQLLKDLSDDPALEGLHIWHPIRRTLGPNGKAQDVPVADRRMYRKLLGIMTEEQAERVQLHEYRAVSELEEIVAFSRQNPKIGHMTVLAARYDFSFQHRWSEEPNDPKHPEIKKIMKARPLSAGNREDMSVIEGILYNSVYDLSQGVMATMKEIAEQRVLMERIMARVKDEKCLEPSRANNLVDSVIGVRELGKTLKGYRGHMIIVTNEIDTTSFVLSRYTGMDPRLILGLSHNDEIRYEEFFRDYLVSALRDRSDSAVQIPVVGSHNRFLTVVSDAITVNGRDWRGLTAREPDFEEIRAEIAGFGESLFAKKSSSDQDCPKAMVETVKSIMYEGKKGLPAVRASIRYPGNEFNTGLHVRHEEGIPVADTSMLSYMNEKERAIFEQGNDIQRLINGLLVEKGIITEAENFISLEERMQRRAHNGHLLPEINGQAMEEKLIQSLDSRIYLRSKKNETNLAGYSLCQNLFAERTVLMLVPEGATDPLSQAHENERTVVSGICADESHAYALSSRPHREGLEYRIFVFRHGGKMPEHVSGPIHVKGKVESFQASDGKAYLLVSSQDSSSVLEHDFSSQKERKIFDTEGATGIALYRQGLLVAYKNQLRIFDGRSLQNPFHLSEGEIRGAVADSQNGIVAYCQHGAPRDEKACLLAFAQISGSRKAEIAIDSIIFSYHNAGKAIQILRRGNKGIHVDMFNSPGDLFSKSGAHYLHEDPSLARATALWQQDGRVYFAAKPGDPFYAVYHEGNDFFKSVVDNISDFKASNGVVRKNGK